MICPACGARNAASARFCDQCGTRLAPTDDVLALGDRRLVTAVFADLVDYSRLVEELDPEDVRARVDAAFSVLTVAVERYGGTIEKFIGDAVFAVFGSPLARDDDAVRAAMCAISMRDALARSTAEGADEEDDRLHLRIGIATGEVVAAPRDLGGQRGLAYTGQAITTAARLQQLAAPDEIIVHPETVDAARGRLLVEPVTIAGRDRREGSRHRGPDRAAITPLFRLLAVRAESNPVEAGDQFVGREGERARLTAELDRVRRTRRGRALLIVAEPGMGKTRLASELEPVARAAGFGWTWTENASYRSGEPYAHTRLLAERIGIEHGLDAGAFVRRLLFDAEADPETVARISGAVATIARDASFSGWEEELKYVPTDPDQVAADLAELADRFVRRLGEQYGPRVLVIDDHHWEDPSSGPMTERLMAAAADLPFLVLVTMRPGPPPSWASMEHVSSIHLDGLDAVETHRLATSVAGLDLADDDAQRLYERTAGNPLFIRETVRALLTDRDATRGGRLRVKARPTGSVPVTLQAILGARLDSLAPDARAVLQVAAVCGIGFEESMVERLVAEPGGGRPGRRRSRVSPFAQLAAAGLIVPADGKGSWRFAHPLIHDVAYSSLLGPRRRRLHARLADVLEEQGSRLAVGRLARHRAAARDAERALPLLEVATEESLGLGAREEAAGFMDLAASLTNDPDARTRYVVRAKAIRGGTGRTTRRHARRGRQVVSPSDGPAGGDLHAGDGRGALL